MAQKAEYKDLIQIRWEDTGGNKPLKAYGDFKGLFDSIPNKTRLLTTVNGVKKIAVCIDERLVGSQSLSPEEANYVRMAGEGILNPNAENDLRNAGIEGIIIHSSCGAKGIYALNMEGDADEIGSEAVRKLAEKTGVPVIKTVTHEQFRNPFHDARAVFYDGTGRFDTSRVPEFPLPGFIISRALLSCPNYAKTEADVAVTIAQGSHGFGRRFTPDSPLYLVAITDNQQGSIKSDTLVRELKEVAAKHEAVSVDLILAR